MTEQPITPEQMRALADRKTWRLTAYESEMRTALRAADQLEAVGARVRDYYYYENGFTESSADHLIAFLTADTAPQIGYTYDADEHYLHSSNTAQEGRDD